MKRPLLWILGIVCLSLVAGLIIPSKTTPPNDTRVILEHTHETYIAPPCFEQANPTNNIDETTLETAREMGYPAHDTCTESELENEKSHLLAALLKKIGLFHTKWDKW